MGPLKKFSIKFGIVCSMIIGASSATNAVLGTVQEWNNTFERAPVVEMVEGTEGEVTASSAPEENAIPLWSWYVFAAGAGITMIIFIRMNIKEKREEKSFSDKTTRIDTKAIKKK